LTLAILASLGIGIGANSAIFSVVDALLLRPLPYPDPDRLAAVWLHSPAIGILRDWPSPGQYVDIQNQNHSFDQMAIAQSRTFTLTGREQAERVDVLLSVLHIPGSSPRSSFTRQRGQRINPYCSQSRHKHCHPAKHNDRDDAEKVGLRAVGLDSEQQVIE
jgi:hypothetical protein